MYRKIVSMGPKWASGWPVLLAALLGGGLTACQTPSKAPQSKAVPVTQPAVTQSAEPQVVKPAVTGFVTTLEDEVKALPNQHQAWSTYWKLCWQPYGGAIAYELQAVTSEVVSPKLKRQSDSCFRLQAAANVNHQSQGLRYREETLAMHSVQLGYRVRAVLDGNRVTAWSAAMPVGAAATASPSSNKR
jgi:hypothetical protein